MLAQVQAVIDALAERLQRSVVVNDPDVRFLCASPHYGDEDRVRTEAILQRQAGPGAVGHVLAQGVGRWSRPGTIPAEPALGMHARLCVPVRWRGEMLGMVLVVDAEGSLDPAEVQQVVAVADELAVLLLAGRSDGPPRDRGPRDAVLDGLLDALLDPAPAVRHDAVRAAGSLVDTTATPYVRVLVLAAVGPDPGREVEPAHAAAALRHAVGGRDAPVAARTVGTVRDTDAVVLLASAEPLPGAVVTRYAEGLVRRAEELSAGRFAAVVGVGAGHPGWGDAWRSGAQAVVASRGAGTVVPGPVALWEDLGVHAALLQVGRAGSSGAPGSSGSSGSSGSPMLPDELERLLRVDADGRLVDTLRVFLDRAGNIPAAADELHVHRTTLYYRLDRIRALAGLDLDDGRVRLALHVGLAMADQAACDNRRNGAPALSSGDGGHATAGVACSAP